MPELKFEPSAKKRKDVPAPEHKIIAWADKIWKDPPLQLVKDLAHELRNPLTNIDLSVEMLETEMLISERKLYLEIIKRSSKRINDLVKELLRYQHAADAGSATHSINQLVSEVIETTSDRIMLKNIAVTKTFSENDCQTVFNRPNLKIALTNIVINAIDAMQMEKGRLKLVTWPTGNKYIVEIEDNGCGISKENLKKIFDPFYTKKPGGLGLGLSATYDILQANQVGLNVRSKEGKGTCFTLLFDKKPPALVINNKLI